MVNLIGKTILDRRKELGVTQAQLSELAGIGINTLTRIERGKGNPTLLVLEKVLNVLGMEISVKPTEV